jgi:hypothetical protein
MAVHPSPRTRSARLTLLGLLLIPLLSLAGLWGLTASITLGNVIRDEQSCSATGASGLTTSPGPGPG